MDYTIEDFQIEMQDCNSPEEMSAVIEKLLDSNIDITDKEVKELVLEYRKQIEDYRMDLKIEMDQVCNKWIESGLCELYMCKSDIQYWKANNRYYVRIDDTKSQYLEKIKDVIDRLDSEVIDRFNSMKPLIWIISDNGIGTLKEHHVFTGQYDGLNFEDYFEKIMMEKLTEKEIMFNFVKKYSNDGILGRNGEKQYLHIKVS
jgi:hypothetical protein